MRDPHPLVTELTVKPLRSFAVGSLVFLPAGEAAPRESVAPPGSVPGVVCSCLRPSPSSAVFLFDGLVDGADTYARGDFIYDAGDPDFFSREVAGIEHTPSFQVNVADIEVGGISTTNPHGGAIAFTSAGPQIGTLTPANVRGLFDPTKFTIQIGTIIWGRMVARSSKWRLIWTTPSGGEAVLDF